MRPYIGVTNITDWRLIHMLLKVYNTWRPRGSQRQLHVGVMMSYKTLHGIPSRWQDVFAKREDIPRIFSRDDTYNCLHYADYGTDDPDVARSISLAIEQCGIGIHAVQLDMPWPDPGKVQDGVDRSRKHLEVILQVGRRALEEVGNDPDSLVEKLEDYESVIHRVLLDRSGGEGREMNATELLVYGRAIHARFPNLGLVWAGGLKPGKLHVAQPIANEFPGSSIDAQAGLTATGSSLDPIDLNVTRKYLAEALQLFP